MSAPSYSGADAAASLIMSETARGKSVVFVEGPCEVLLLEHHHPDCKDRIYPCGGHLGVREAIGAIEKWEQSKSQSLSVLGFLDKDYGASSRYRRITTTNFRDIEVDLYLTPASKRLLREKASKVKCQNPERTIEEAIESLRIVGIVREYNSRNSKGWSINTIRIEKCLVGNGAFDSDKFIDLLCQRNSIDLADRKALTDHIKSECEAALPYIIRGHDISVVLGKWLKKRIGNRSGSETSKEVMEENLRLSSRWSEITEYNWGKRISAHLSTQHMKPKK